MEHLKDILEDLYHTPYLKNYIKNDPIEFPHLFQEAKDIEVAGFIASAFAFGRVDLFKKTVHEIISISGNNIYEFIVNFDLPRDGKYFKGLYYRMCREDDIIAFIFILSKILSQYGTLGNLFYSLYNTQPDIRATIIHFIKVLRSIDVTPVYGQKDYPRGLLHLLPSPVKGGACKRVNMFLRWMIRPDDGIDFGLWDHISPSVLVIPVDTHIAKISKAIGLTKRRTISWKMAEEITEGFRRFSPHDPLKYDFALCHLGINGLWKEVLFNGKKLCRA